MKDNKTAIKNKIILLVSFLSLMILVNCNKEESPKDDPTENPNKVIIAKEAIVINNQIWNENFISIDSTNYTLTLKEGINSLNINQGDIIVSSENEGLLRKVKHLNQIGDKIIIATESATLSEVIKQGVIEYSQPLTTSQIKDIEYMYEGVGLTTDLVKSNGNVFNWDIDAVLYDLDGSQETKNDQIKLVGKFNCDWRILLKIDIGISNGIKEVKFGFVSNEELNLKIIGNVSYEFEKDITLAKVNFKPIVIMVGAVPVVFTPQLKIMVGVDGYSEGSITSEVSQNLSFDAGIHYLKGQGWSPFKTFEKSLAFKTPQLVVSASASMYLKPELSIKVYSLAGPYANTKIYGKLEASFVKTPWWTLYGGIKMSAGAKVDILDKFLLDFTVSDLINLEQVLAQATTPPPQTATIKTVTPREINSTSAKSGGEIISDGGATVTARGVCWSTSPNPTAADSKTDDGTGNGSFTSSLTGLTPNTTYYVRAYATNSKGTAYGNQVSFKTDKLNIKTVIIQPDPQQGKDATVDYVEFYSGTILYKGYADDEIIRIHDFINDKKEALFQFDITQIPQHSQIISATIHMYSSGYLADLPTTVKLGKITSPWNEATVKWDNKPSYVNYTNAVITIGGYHWLHFNVKTLVQEWVDGTANYGVYMTVTQINTAVNIYSSDNQQSEFRPKLEISYF